MNSSRRVASGRLVSLALSAAVAAASSATAAERPRVGLALSGGGARGFAHVGVIRALEAAGVPIDVIAGTSFGALVGGLYAAGRSPAEIEALLTADDWNTLASDAPVRRLLSIDEKARYDRRLLSVRLDRLGVSLPRGLQTGQRITDLLARESVLEVFAAGGDFDRLDVGFRAVATNLIDGSAYVFARGPLHRAIRASIAVPGLLTPVELADTLLVDGGIADNVPVAVARAAGANLVIAVDVSTPLKETKQELRSLLDVLDQAISFHIEENKARSLADADLVIRPDIGSFSSSDFAHGGSLIPLGEAAVEASLDELRGRLEEYGIPPPSQPRPRPRPPGPREVVLAELRFEGVSARRAKRLARLVRTPVREPVGPRAFERDVAILYGTGLFKSVSYRLETGTAGPTLSYELDNAATTELGLGLRYDDEYGFNALLDAVSRDILESGADLSVTGVVGDVEHLAGALKRRPLAGLPLSGRLRVVAQQQERSSPGEGGDERYEERRYRLELGVERLFDTRGGLGLAWELERVAIRDGEGRFATAAAERLAGLALDLQLDTRDDVEFPTGGLAASAHASWRPRALGSSVEYASTSTRAGFYATPLAGTTLGVGGSWSLASARTPAWEQTRIGGSGLLSFAPERFIGLERDAITARHAAILDLSLRRRLAHFELTNLTELAVGAEYQLGAFSPADGSLGLTEVVHGFGIGLYLGTRFPGPVRLELTKSDRSAVRTTFSAGHAF